MKPFITLFLITIVLFACKKENGPETTPNSTSTSTQNQIRYEVTCTDCWVAFQNGSNQQEAVSPVSGTWQKTITPTPGQYIMVGASTNNPPEMIYAKIFLNGQIIKQGHSWCATTAAIVLDTIAP